MSFSKGIFKETLMLLTEAHGHVIWLTYFYEFMMELISTYLLFQILSGEREYIAYFLIVKIMEPIVSVNICRRIRNNIIKNMQEIYNEKEHIRYDSLSFRSKNQSTVEEFRMKLSKATWIFEDIIGWGLGEFESLISAFFSCFYVFIKNQLYILGIIILITNILAYHFYLKKSYAAYYKKKDELRERNNKIDILMTLILPMFQYKEKKVADILSLDNEMKNNIFIQSELWIKLNFTSAMINKIGLVFIIFNPSSDLSSFLLIINCLGQFSGAIASLFNFLNNFNRVSSDYSNYVDFWNDLEFEKDAKKLPLPDIIIIKNVKVEQGDLKIVFEKGISNLQIKQGHKILITGRSGHGKTTFVNALMGKIPGIEFEENCPENYFHHFVELFQNIKENLPTSSITVRQLFEDETNDEIILNCCRLAKVHKWINSLKSSNRSKEAIIIDLNPVNPLDVEIKERISGGQKTRLAIATRLYKLTKENKKILILDEPEQGSDPPVAYKIIHNIMDEFKNVTLIVVSHLEILEQKEKWDHLLTIRNGIIRRK